MYVELLGYDFALDEGVCSGWEGDIDLPDELEDETFIQEMASHLHEFGGRHFDRLWLIIPDVRCVAGVYREGDEFHLNSNGPKSKEKRNED